MSDTKNIDNKADSGKAPKSSKPKASAKGKKSPVVKYLKELKSELKKVVWPSREKVINNTVVVLSGMVLAALLIYAFDLGLGALMQVLISFGS